MSKDVQIVSTSGPLVKIALSYAYDFLYKEIDADEGEELLSVEGKEALVMFESGMFNGKKFRVISSTSNVYYPAPHSSKLTIDYQSWNVKVHIVREGLVIDARFRFKSKKLLSDIKSINQLERATKKPVKVGETNLERGL